MNSVLADFYHYGELFQVYCIVFDLIHSWVEHAARKGDMGNAYKILAGKPEGKNQPKRLSVDERIILQWTLK